MANKGGGVGRNFLWNASYQLLLIIVPLVTTPYLSRVLGAEKIGLYSYTYSIANYFVIFSIMGMGQHGVRAIARAGDDRVLRSRVFWSAWIAQLCFAVPAVGLYLLYTFSGPAGGMEVTAIWGLWVLSAALDISWLYFGVEEFRLPTARSVVTKIASIVFIFAFVHDANGLPWYCFSIAAASMCNSILLLPFVGRYCDFIAPSFEDIKSHFVPNLRLFAPVVAISLYSTFDKILLGSFSGMTQAGYFEYSEKITKMPMAIITALGTVMLPHMTHLISSGNKEEAKQVLRSSLWAMESVAIALMFGISAVSKELSLVFLGPEFAYCANVMPIVSMAIPLISASNVIGVQYMLPTCSDIDYTRSVFLGAVVNVVLCLVLLKPYGAIGAAIATVATEAVVLAFQCWRVRHELPLKSCLAEMIPLVFFGILMYVIVRASVKALSPALGVDWLLLAIEIFIGVLSYGAMFVIWCVKSHRVSSLKAMLL